MVLTPSAKELRMIARWVTDLSPGTAMVPFNGRPGVMVSDAISNRHSRLVVQSFALLLRLFQCLFDACPIRGVNKMLQLIQMPFVGINQCHKVFAIPEQDVAPHFRRTGRNPSG